MTRLHADARNRSECAGAGRDVQCGTWLYVADLETKGCSAIAVGASEKTLLLCTERPLQTAIAFRRGVKITADGCAQQAPSRESLPGRERDKYLNNNQNETLRGGCRNI
eukprot:scaffold11528_cov59-Phaeocystis_antarctica.AAC.4